MRRTASRYSRKSAPSGARGSMTSSGIFAKGLIEAQGPLMSNDPHLRDQYVLFWHITIPIPSTIRVTPLPAMSYSSVRTPGQSIPSETLHLGWITSTTLIILVLSPGRAMSIFRVLNTGSLSAIEMMSSILTYRTPFFRHVSLPNCRSFILTVSRVSFICPAPFYIFSLPPSAGSEEM